jgi:hypothetical protein
MENLLDIACQQVLKEDASVFSLQCAVFPGKYSGKLTPDFIMESYFSYLRKVTLTFARPVRTANGVEFRFLFTRFHLLTFAAPLKKTEKGIDSVTLRICGGQFVQGGQCNRGKFSFSCEKVPEGIRVEVRLSDYFPRLLGSGTPGLFRKSLYRFTQAFIHKFVTTRFLVFLFKELDGGKPCFRIVPVHEETGEDI